MEVCETVTMANGCLIIYRIHVMVVGDVLSRDATTNGK